MSQYGGEWIIFHQSWYEGFKEMPAKELTEANCHARLNCSTQLLNDFYSSFGSVTKEFLLKN